MKNFRSVGLALAVLSATAGPAAAAVDEAQAYACRSAYDGARYQDAQAVCRPLAEQGSADAQSVMGALYRDGRGLARDYGEAARWFNLAARQGHGDAQFNVATLYRYGAGVPRDLIEAYAWFDLAMAAGNEEAAASRSLIEQNMTLGEIDEAQSRAAGFAQIIRNAKTAAAAYDEAPAASAEEADALQAMVDELRAIADRARIRRSGDYRLLGQLNDLAARYDRPWRYSLLDDNFADGNFTASPAWTVAAGAFTVDTRYGLRNRVTAPATFNLGSGSQGGGDAAAQLFGAILGAVTKKQAPAGGQGARAEIHIPLAIGGVFSAQVEVGTVSPSAEGNGFEFGAYDGARRDGGYRLIYSQGASPSLALVRLSRGRMTTVARAVLPAGLEDNAYHTLTFRRGRDGTMEVLLDDETVMSGTDITSAGQSFQGFTLINRGGEYAFRRVVVMGSSQ